MAENTDIMISVEADIAEALKNIQELEKSLKTTQSTINNQLAPSTTTMGGKIQNLGGKLSGLGNTLKSKIGLEGALAFGAIGAACTKFAKDCVSSAMTAEREWTRFGAIVNSNGGNWEQESAKTKKWAKNLSTQLGYAVSDTREAMMSLAQYGVKNGKEMETAMLGVAGVAARTGQTEAEASNMVISALNGRGMQLAKLTGLRIEDYKSADGQIDRERLLKDLYEQNKEAIEAHANTTEAQIQRINNSWASFKSQIGQALMPVVKIVADVVGGIVNWFSNMPDGMKTAIAALVSIGAVIGTVISAIGFLAPVLITAGDALVAIGGIVTTVAGVFGPIIAAMTGAAATGGGLTAIIGAGATAFGALLAPISGILLPIGALIAAFAALYFIGASMGWWDDLGGMISRLGEALSWAAGQVMGFLGIFQPLAAAVGDFLGWVMKLFTDFPGAIADAGNLFSSLRETVLGAMGSLGDIIGDAFQSMATSAMDGARSIGSNFASGVQGFVGNITSIAGEMGGAFLDALDGAKDSIVSYFSDLGSNVVPAMNQFISDAVTALGGLGSQAIGVVESAINSIGTTIWNGITSYLQFSAQVRTEVINFIMTLGMTIVTTVVTSLQQAVTTAGMLVMNIRNAIITRFMNMVQGVRSIWNMITSTVRNTLNNARMIAANLALMIRTVIITRWNALVAKTRQIFTNIVNNIRSRLANAVSQAKAKAKEIYDGIKNKITNIPTMVAEEFGKIKDRIINKLNEAKSAAVSKISDLVSAVKSALGIASPGYIQRMMMYEFNSIPGIITSSARTSVRGASEMASGIVNAWMNNMETLSVPFESLKENILPELGVGLTRNMTTSNILDPTLLMNNPLNPRLIGTGTSSTQNVTNDNTQHTTVHIDHISLECAELTQAQSRRVLYDALDGLYTGGI